MGISGLSQTFLVLLLLSSNAYSQIEYPQGKPTAADTDLEGLQWNRYTTDNFVILSIDNDQGRWLYQNVEKIKLRSLIRWGFPRTSDDFTQECRIFCVPDKTLMKKLFSIDGSKVEVRKDVTVAWLILDEKPAKSVAPYISQICFAEFEKWQKVQLGFWFKRGASILNSGPAVARSRLEDLAKNITQDHQLFTSKKIFSFTEQDYNQETEENREIFDQEAVALCVLLRKEFGEAKLQGMLRISNRNDPETVLNAVYGFNDYNHFDKQFIRFMRDLSNEINKGKVPDGYLDIKAVERK